MGKGCVYLIQSFLSPFKQDYYYTMVAISTPPM